MATNFPSSLDSFTNPTAVDTLDSPPHDTQHADANDAIEAIETALLDGAPLHIDDANERVGVGNTSPSYKLDVTGDINATGDLRIGGTQVAAVNTFTPVVTQGTTTFTVTTSEASYYQINKLVYGVVFVTIASGTGQAGQLVTVDLPINTTSVGGSVVGSAWIFDSNTATGYGGQTVCPTSTYFQFVGDWSGGNAFGILPAIQLTTSDQVRFNFCYEVA